MLIVKVVFVKKSLQVGRKGLITVHLETEDSFAGR